MDFNKKTYELEQKYEKRMEKKMQGKPLAVRIIMSRTFSSAFMILGNIMDIPFENLIFDIYSFCKDPQFVEIIKMFDAELELAGADPEKFIFHLNSFYNDVSNKIKKENKYHEFAEFIGMVVRLQQENKKGLGREVIDAYLCIVLQTLEYLREDKFDLSTCAYGVSLDGNLLMGPYPLAFSDLPVIEYKEAIRNGKKFKNFDDQQQFMLNLYKKRGININGMDDLIRLNQTQKIHSVTTIALFPFINEFTFDIVPLQFYNSYEAPLSNLLCPDFDIESMKTSLCHRNRTLPSNGTVFEITDLSGELSGALLKEIVYHDTVYMLYRLDTDKGSLSGYYDTKDMFLFSVTEDARPLTSFNNLSALILSMYATQVLNDFSIDEINKMFLQNGFFLVFRAFGKGGVLENKYHPSEKPQNKTSRNPDAYNKEDRYINVIIRKLPAGKQASEEAKQLAVQYGYELEPGQTFVRPFIRQVFVKKDPSK